MQAHPAGKSFGVMDGMNTKSLKLSQLVAGDYCFKVVVTSDGKYGEASVNVTVLARECRDTLSYRACSTARFSPQRYISKQFYAAFFGGSTHVRLSDRLSCCNVTLLQQRVSSWLHVWAVLLKYAAAELMWRLDARF